MNELENRMYLEGRACNWGIPEDNELTPPKKRKKSNLKKLKGGEGMYFYIYTDMTDRIIYSYDPRFKEKFKDPCRVRKEALADTILDISNWCHEELGESAIFET